MDQTDLDEAPVLLKENRRGLGGVALKWRSSMVGRGQGMAATATLRNGVVAVFVVQGLAALARYAMQILFARAGGLSNYGYFAFAFSWINLLTVPAAFGFTVGVLRFVPLYVARENWDKVRGVVRFGIHVTVLASVTIASVATLAIVASGVSGPKAYALLAGFWILVPVALVGLTKQAIRAAFSVFRAYGIGELLPPLLTIAVVIPIYLERARLSSVSMVVLLGAGFMAVAPLQWLSLRHVYPRAYTGVRPAYDRRLWLVTSIPLVSVAALQGATNNMDMVLVGFLRGPIDTGLYGAANRLALQINFILVGVNAVVMPMVATAFAKEDHTSLERSLHFGVRWSFWPTVVIATALLAAPGPCLTLFGSRFGAAVGPLRILAVAGLFGAVSGPVGAALAVTGHQRVLARVTIIAFVVGLAIEVGLIPTLGITGAAIGDAVQTVFWNGWLYWEVRRRLGVKLYGFV